MNDEIEDIIEDLFKIYLSSIDSYNSKIYQVVNDKYTVIDKSMITIYLFIKIIEDRNEKNEQITNTLSNYLLKQIIYSETGNISFKVDDNSKKEIYHEILQKLILEKFQYKNRIMRELKYNYKIIGLDQYSELLMFLEDIAELVIFNKMILKGNTEIEIFYNSKKSEIINQLNILNTNEYFYKEKKNIIDLIINDKFNESQYGNLVNVALNLKDVYRYSQITTRISRKCTFSPIYSYNNELTTCRI